MTDRARWELNLGLSILALGFALGMLARAMVAQAAVERERRRDLVDADRANDELRARNQELEKRLAERGEPVDHEGLRRPDAPAEEQP
jgi:cell division protein FtsB